MYGVKETLEMLENKVKGHETYVYSPPMVRCIDPYTGEEVEIESGSCTYSNPDGSPSCLVGQVIYDVVPDEVWGELHDYEYQDGGSPDSTSVSELPAAKDIFTKKAIDVLRVAQNSQDMGHTWGESLSSALELARGLEDLGDPL